jgi:hypothetical protein
VVFRDTANSNELLQGILVWDIASKPSVFPLPKTCSDPLTSHARQQHRMGCDLERRREVLRRPWNGMSLF